MLTFNVKIATIFFGYYFYKGVSYGTGNDCTFANSNAAYTYDSGRYLLQNKNNKRIRKQTDNKSCYVCGKPHAYNNVLSNRS